MRETIIQVFGRVQGVFYRAHAREKARKLGLAGWVRNNDDGSVTACIQGPAEKVNEFITWCENGPDAANVHNTRIEVQNAEKEYIGFEIID